MNLKNTKEIAAKFIVGRYRDGKTSLDELIEITNSLISHIMGLPSKLDLVPLATKPLELVEEFTWIMKGNNAKGLIISQVT